MKLTKTERKVYDFLAMLCGLEVRQVSLSALALKSGVSQQSVKRAIQSLEKAGMIAIHRSKLYGRQQANVYTIL